MMNTIAIIVAADENNGIGLNNQLPWKLSNDLRKFKQLTTGHVVVMGRKTWESLPKKPLPERDNIVLTSDKAFSAKGATVVHSMNEILAHDFSPKTVFIIGGAQVYRQFFPYAQHLYLTRVHKVFEVDTKLGGLNLDEWELISSETPSKTDNDCCEYSFMHYQRK